MRFRTPTQVLSMYLLSYRAFEKCEREDVADKLRKGFFLRRYRRVLDRVHGKKRTRYAGRLELASYEVL